MNFPEFVHFLVLGVCRYEILVRKPCEIDPKILESFVTECPPIQNPLGKENLAIIRVPFAVIFDKIRRKSLLKVIVISNVARLTQILIQMQDLTDAPKQQSKFLITDRL